jgi:hypothetical protein
MLRIGGNVQGFVAADETANRFNREVVSLPHGMALVRMTPQWMVDIDDLTQQPVSVLMTGFDLLSAGVIEYAQSVSQHGVLGYVERRWGLEIVDSAVAWHRGKTVAGPSGTSVTADSPNSAFSAVLHAFGLDLAQQTDVLCAVAEC